MNDSLCTPCSKLGSWRYGKIHGVDKVLLQFKKSLFVLFYPTAESVNCSLFLKNLEKHFYDLTFKKKASSNTLKIYRNIYRKNLLAIIYRLPISLQEVEIYRLSASPRAFLKLSIIVIALVQKGLSCPSLVVCSEAF